MAYTPRIVIMGRPNVGKSTLFNRLIGRRRALVHDEPGVTRDRIEHPAEWTFEGKQQPVLLIDTGGVGGDRFAEEIDNQVGIALQEADAAVIVFDSQVGITPGDEEIVKRLQRAGLAKRLAVFGVVNKVDADAHEVRGSEFYALGIDPILTISAEHNRGIDDLKDTILNALREKIEANAGEPEPVIEAPFEESEENEEDEKKFKRGPPRIAIVGRPNVGKSTLTNAILGQDRMITSPIAGTTVDAIDSKVMISGKEFVLVDTAGIRRKSKTEKGIEVLSVVQAKKALENADVAILMLDAESGVSDQDEKIGGLIEEAGCSVILAMNKWDLQRKNVKFTKEMASERIRAKMGYLKYAPIIFLSAKEGRGFRDLGDLITEILHQRALKIPTNEFTTWVRKESTVHNPANVKFYMCHQAGRHPPTFVCHVNNPEKVDFSLQRHLVNALRERWGFMGTPVRLLFVEAEHTKLKK